MPSHCLLANLSHNRCANLQSPGDLLELKPPLLRALDILELSGLAVTWPFCGRKLIGLHNLYIHPLIKSFLLEEVSSYKPSTFRLCICHFSSSRVEGGLTSTRIFTIPSSPRANPMIPSSTTFSNGTTLVIIPCGCRLLSSSLLITVFQSSGV